MVQAIPVEMFRGERATNGGIRYFSFFSLLEAFSFLFLFSFLLLEVFHVFFFDRYRLERNGTFISTIISASADSSSALSRHPQTQSLREHIYKLIHKLVIKLPLFRQLEKPQNEKRSGSNQTWLCLWLEVPARSDIVKLWRESRHTHHIIITTSSLKGTVCLSCR